MTENETQILEASKRVKALTLKYVEHQKTGTALNLELEEASCELARAIMGDRWDNVKSWLPPFDNS